MTGQAVSTHDVTVLDDRVVKRFRSTDRGEYRREWHALHLLARHAPGLAPAPLATDPVGPSVTMTRVAGAPLGGAPLDARQLDALGVALDRLHGAVPLAAARACGPTIAHPGALAPRVGAMLAGGPGTADDDRVVAAAHEAAGRWLGGAEAWRLRDNAEPRAVFGRDDHNLANFLWDGTRVHLVDFENSGCSDRPAELASLVEHVSARCTPDTAWAGLLDRMSLRAADRVRLLGVRRLHAAFWLAVLLPGRPGESRNPPGTLRRQAERLLALL